MGCALVLFRVIDFNLLARSLSLTFSGRRRFNFGRSLMMAAGVIIIIDTGNISSIFPCQLPHAEKNAPITLYCYKYGRVHIPM